MMKVSSWIVNRKRIIMGFLCVVFLLSTANVAMGGTYRVTATALKIRAADSEKATVVGRLQQGDTVVVLCLSEDKQWGSINQPQKGWVSMKYLHPIRHTSTKANHNAKNTKPVRWIVQQTWFLDFLSILNFLLGVEVLVLFVFAFKRRRILDLWFRFVIVVGIITGAIHETPVLVYLLPTCFAAAVYYPLLYSNYDAGDKRNMLIFISIIVFYIPLFIVSQMLSLSILGFIIRAVAVFIANVGLFEFIYFWTDDHECPHCHYYARHETVDEVVTGVGYSKITKEQSETLASYYCDSQKVAEKKQEYTEDDIYEDTYIKVKKKCWRCGGYFSYDKSRSKKIGTSRRRYGRKYTEYMDGTRKY